MALNSYSTTNKSDTRKVIDDRRLSLCKISHWLDKLNANIGNDAMQVNGSSSTRYFSPDKAGLHDRSDRMTDLFKKIESEEIRKVESSQCFRFAQLTTELLLIIFAVSLLVVAGIVIVSRRTPALMQSYEVVPEFLFFLIIITAILSLCNWMWERARRPALVRSGLVEQTLFVPRSLLSTSSPALNNQTQDIPPGKHLAATSKPVSSQSSKLQQSLPYIRLDPTDKLKLIPASIAEECISSSVDSLDIKQPVEIDRRKYLPLGPH